MPVSRIDLFSYRPSSHPVPRATHSHLIVNALERLCFFSLLLFLVLLPRYSLINFISIGFRS